MAVIHVGTSGFSFDDWRGPVYPPDLPKSGMLEYYASVLGFGAVELNYTYYSMPAPRTLESMLGRVGTDFIFVVRSHRSMTHEIWADSGRKVMTDSTAAFRQFQAGIDPLASAGRLGCVLVQLPVFFYPVPASIDYLRRLTDLLPGTNVVVEFRNRAWLRDSTFRLLSEEGLGFCVVDEPRLARLMPYEPRRTTDMAYFRFHGRNPNWFGASRSERYDYFYSPGELADLCRPLRVVTADAATSFVFFNNCHAGAAARNALLAKQMLGLLDSFSAEQQRIVVGADGAAA